MDTCSLQAQNSSRPAPMPTQSRICQGRRTGRSRRISGNGRNLLGLQGQLCAPRGTAADEMEPTVEESVALARRSGMPSAMVISLNSLAMTLAERNPTGPRQFSARASNSRARPARKSRQASSPPPWLPGKLRDWKSDARGGCALHAAVASGSH